MSTHRTTDELAAAAAGALSEPVTTEIDRHVADCPACAATLDQLRTVSDALSIDADTLTMPPEITARLTAVITAESRRRASGEAERDLAIAQSEHAKRLTTGSFGENVPTRRRTGIPQIDLPPLDREPHPTA